MFLHKVREYLERTAKDILPNSPLDNNTRMFLSMSRDAQCFHVGDPEFFFDMFDQDNRHPFDDNSYLRFPYNACWFDWYRPTDMGRKHREGALVIAEPVTHDFFVILVAEVDRDDWLVIPVVIDVKYKDGEILFHVGKTIPEDMKKTIMEEYLNPTMMVIDSFLKFLSARNVKRVRKDPSQKLQKKRLKANKLPLYSYWVLKLPHRGEIVSQPSSGSGSAKRIHWCRGHFKQRETGIFWWSAHIRGRGKGVIDKDYES